jgi:hypothetical protein
MKLQGLGTRRQAITLGIVLLGLGLIAARFATGGGSAGPAATSASRVTDFDPESSGGAPARGGKRAAKKEVSANEVPPITKEDLEPHKPAASALAGRDLFDFRPPTPVPPPLPPPTPTPQPVCGDPRYVGACPPTPPPPPTPTPAPPEIGFRCIGTFGPRDNPIAVLIQGDQIVNARAGDVVFDRFKVVRVGFESVEIGFVDGIWHWKETRRLAIAP